MSHKLLQMAGLEREKLPDLRQAVGMGRATFEMAAEQAEVARVYEPNPANRAVYDALYQAFLEIYKRNKGIYGRLNKTA